MARARGPGPGPGARASAVEAYASSVHARKVSSRAEPGTVELGKLEHTWAKPFFGQKSVRLQRISTGIGGIGSPRCAPEF